MWRRTSRLLAALVVLLAAAAAAAGPATAAGRSAGPLLREGAGSRSPEIAFDAATGMVTIRVSLHDLDGFALPYLRRDNFAVYENGVRLRDVDVEVEHAPIALAVLIEMGGRSQQLNKVLASEAPYLARPILDVLGPNDRLAVFTYDDQLHTIVDFDAPHDRWEATVRNLPQPRFSEANFYDAASAVLERLEGVSGRRALLVISTGIDTFSRATFEEVRQEAEAAKIPVYVLGIGDIARQAVLDGRGPAARIDWRTCTRQLETLARASGGRAYMDAVTVAAPAIYDDIMEDLRVRYVITYASSLPTATPAPRTVEVRLVDPRTNAPLRITDASGRPVAGRALAQATYTPTVAPARRRDEHASSAAFPREGRLRPSALGAPQSASGRPGVAAATP